VKINNGGINVYVRPAPATTPTQDPTGDPSSPLLEQRWALVAHMKNSGGMFAGDSKLSSAYYSGTFVENPSASDVVFYRPFAANSSEILFITGKASTLPAAATWTPAKSLTGPHSCWRLELDRWRR
jgi:hypothetical protein